MPASPPYYQDEGVLLILQYKHSYALQIGMPIPLPFVQCWALMICFFISFTDCCQFYPHNLAEYLSCCQSEGTCTEPCPMWGDLGKGECTGLNVTCSTLIALLWHWKIYMLTKFKSDNNLVCWTCRRCQANVIISSLVCVYEAVLRILSCKTEICSCKH